MSFKPRQLPPEDYSWLTNLGKALRDAAGVALVGALALAFGVFADVLTPERLAELQVPSYYALVIVAVFRGLQNFLRVRLGWPVVVAILSVLGLSAAPAHASEAVRKILVEPIISPHLVVGAGYDSNAAEGVSKFSVLVTANILGPRLGDWPCNLGGFGVGLETIAPGLEGVSIARASVPLVTCAPFGGRVVLQAGAASTIGGSTGGEKSFYGGVGVNLTTSTEEQDVKRAARIKAKEKKALLNLQDEAQRRPAS